MNKPMYIYVPFNGFIMDFDKSGPVLKFTEILSDSEKFDTTHQANHIINVNSLGPLNCVILYEQPNI